MNGLRTTCTPGLVEDTALDPASKFTVRHAHQLRLVRRDRPVLTCRDVHQSVELISHGATQA